MTYPLEEHRQALGRLTRDPEKCTCQPLNPRHTDGYHCITLGQIAMWKQRDTMVAAVVREMNQIMTREAERRHAWLWLHWSHDVIAKHLSGRPLNEDEQAMVDALLKKEILQ